MPRAVGYGLWIMRLLFEHVRNGALLLGSSGDTQVEVRVPAENCRHWYQRLDCYRLSA